MHCFPCNSRIFQTARTIPYPLIVMEVTKPFEDNSYDKQGPFSMTCGFQWHALKWCLVRSFKGKYIFTFLPTNLAFNGLRTSESIGPLREVLIEYIQKGQFLKQNHNKASCRLHSSRRWHWSPDIYGTRSDNNSNWCLLIKLHWNAWINNNVTLSHVSIFLDHTWATWTKYLLWGKKWYIIHITFK